MTPQCRCYDSGESESAPWFSAGSRQTNALARQPVQCTAAQTARILQRPCHDRRRFVWMVASFLRKFFRSPKRHEVGSKCVERREECGTRCDSPDHAKEDTILFFAVRCLSQHRENVVFAPEACEQRNARQCRCPDQESPVSDRQGVVSVH